MAVARLVLRLHNFRVFDDVVLNLGPLSVIIGDNGSGKSTVLEALEILRRATTSDFLDHVNLTHGGPGLLARDIGKPVVLSLEAHDRETERWFRYELELAASHGGLGATVYREQAVVSPKGGHQNPFVLFQQDRGNARYYRKRRWQPLDLGGRTILSAAAVGTLLEPHYDVSPIIDLLTGIQPQAGWEVTPLWVARSTDRRSKLRESGELAATDKLGLLGLNLVAVIHELKNSSMKVWDQFLHLTRTGLELPVETINVRPSGDGRTATIGVRLSGMDREIPAAALSEGQLAWIAWCSQLSAPKRPSVLAIDEPDRFLHFALAKSLMGHLVEFSQRSCVVLSTHSNALLDALPDPASQVLLLRLSGNLTSRPHTVTSETLKRWKADTGLSAGGLRADGTLDMLAVPAPQDPPIPPAGVPGP